MHPHPGEVWLADLGIAGKVRPVVVVSRYDPDAPRALVIYIPITSQNRHSAYEVEMPAVKFLDRDSVANVQGIGSLPTARLQRKLGNLPAEVLSEMKRALGHALEMYGRQ